MTNRSVRTAGRLVFILGSLTLPVGLLWAQNENETVGFQSNHIFESGHFGEDIDVLNGDLHLTIPIGPKYQVNDRLSYQLGLHYNSKIWNYDDFNPNSGNSIKLVNEGPLGVGFTLSFGRLLQDAHNASCGTDWMCYQRTWKWVTSDGNQHDVWFAKDSPAQPDVAAYPLKTGDASYIRVNNGGCASQITTPCKTVSTPDGLTYTLSQVVQYAETIDQDLRVDNLSFGGWYVTRIEDRSIGTADSNTGLYPNHVVITYETRTNFEHVIKEIRDSRGRVITFHNRRYGIVEDCLNPTMTAASDRSEVGTCQIDLPAFVGSEAPNSSDAVAAHYKFAYAYGSVNRYYPAPIPEGLTVSPAGPTLELKRLDYPAYVHPSGTAETYSLYFDYSLYAELSCRTLPLPQDVLKSCGDWTGARTTFGYTYEPYRYIPLYLSPGSARIGVVQDGTPTRAVTQKTILESVPSGQATRAWSYARDMTPATTNPSRVTVTDAVGNDTIYYYHASYYPTNQNPAAQVGIYPDDGLAPEWNDGLNYKVEYYRGTGTTRTLVRTEDREYETDTRVFGTQLRKSKENSRVQRTATVFNDDGAIEKVVSNSGWDGFGNWRTVSETGFGVAGVRNTLTDYYTLDISTPGSTRVVYLTGLSHYREIHDGFHVLERTENFYDPTDGRLNATIARRTLPATLGTPTLSTFQKGDVKTTYNHNSTTRQLDSKYISSNGDGTGATTDYCIYYTWTPDWLLKSKTLGNIQADGTCNPTSLLTWKAIDRLRDGNTGLTFEVRDPAYISSSNEIKTTYRYDALGRVTDIIPSGSEFPTVIDYTSLKQTTVTRNPASSTDFAFSRYSYDDFGRLVCEEKRPADASAGYPYQTTRYDILNRVVFKSESLMPGTTCDPNATTGTTSDYGTPPDPFGRIQRVTTADGKVTTMTYQGQDSTVTVEGVVGPGGVAGPVTTKYFRDAWDRLIKVDAPNTGGADAIYGYDLRDNLVQVDLYDQANPLIKQSRFFEFDGRGKLFQAINPENNTTVYGDYDGLGNIRSITGADGVTLKSTYDVAGRLKSSQRSDSGILLVENTYDVGANAAGKISSSISRDELGAVVVSKSFVYGGLNGRLSSLSQTFGGVTSSFPVTYDYDNFGNVKTVVYPEGPAGKGGNLRVDYSFSNGIAVAATEAGTPGLALASVTYNPAGGIKVLTTPQFMQTQITPDSRNRPSKITIGRGTYNPATDSYSARTDYQSGTFGYDGAGNISEMNRPNGLVNLYRYDAANRLVEVYDKVGDSTTNYTQYTQCFRYDDFGNLLGKKDQVTTNTCSQIIGEDLILLLTPPSNVNTNRVINEQRAGAIVNYFYDAKGNVIKDWERRYRYDTRNRAISLSRVSSVSDMSSPSTELGRYDYDGDGNRVVKLDRLRELRTYYVRGPDGKLLSEFRRTELGAYQPEWFQHHVYLAGREVALRENRLPNPPGGLSVSTTRNGSLSDVFVKWRKNPTEDGVTTYKVYRGLGSSMPLVGTSNTSCADPNVICYTDAALSSDTRLDYQVTAQSAVGESYGSDRTWLVTGDITAPNRPTCLSGAAGDRQVKLVWDASTSDDVLGYNVYRRIGTGSGPIIKVTQVPGASTTYLDEGLTNDQVYSYWVRAVDQVGRESADVVNGGEKRCDSTGVACTTNADCAEPDVFHTCRYVCARTTNITFTAMPKDYVPPGPPREVNASGDCGGQGTAHITWDANADTDNVVTYWVYRTPDFTPAGPRSSGNDPQGKPNLFFDDSALSASSTYYYSLKAEDNKANRSVASLQVGIKPRIPSTQLPPPPNQLMLKPGDGQVRVRFDLPSSTTGIDSFVIYRKPNAEPSCTAFQEVHVIERGTPEWPIAATYLDYTDGTATNAIAWDYAVASRASGGESGISNLGLAIPVASPKTFRQCVEQGPPWSPPGLLGEGAVACGVLNRRTVFKWSAPPGKPYQPIGATNADGTLGYLLGYHVARYSQRYGPTILDSNADISVLIDSTYKNVSVTEAKDRNLFCSTTIGSVSSCRGDQTNNCSGNWETCVSMGRCVMDSNPACNRGNGDADCPAGTYCYGTCSVATSTRCRADTDCSPSGGTCVAAGQCFMTLDRHTYPPCVQKADCPATASCRRYDTAIDDATDPVGPFPTDPYLREGVSLTEYYPIRAYLKECGVVSAAYKVYANGNWQTVVSDPLNFDRTKTGADASEGNARCTSLLDQCNMSNPLCSSATEPPSVTNAPQVSSPGPGRIKVTWDSFAGSANAAGYYLYVKENDHNYLLVPKPPHAYGFVSPLPYVTIGLVPPCVDAGKPCYELSALPMEGRIGAPVTYQFQVAVFDPAGNVGAASPPSAEITPQSSVDPIGLKTVIWTENDSSKDGPPTRGVPNPRSFDGIKLQWTGVSNRVYRSESPEGPFCAIVQPGANLGSIPVCPDSTAYSTTVTTGQPGTNTRFFHDKNVVPGKVYHYKVTYFNGTSESGFSYVVTGMAQKHTAQPLSPPRHLKAWGPMVQQTSGSWQAGPGVYLRWCPNPADEGVTGYRIYRAQVPGGPYTRLIDIDNPTDPATLAKNCLMGSQRCEISATTCSSCTSPPCLCKSGTCTIGPGGTCKIVDLYNIAFPLANDNPTTQTQKYYYVVTAVRGTEESGYSNENVALPNYYCASCTPPQYELRFDLDNEGDIACDDEMAMRQSEDEGPEFLATAMELDGAATSSQNTVQTMAEGRLAPYRVIGSKDPSQGGVGGAPVPSAVSRWLFYHTDHLGSPRVVVDASGGPPISQHHYMPFGEEKPIPARVSSNAVMFTGHERDIESASSDNADGLDYMLARYYSSSLGRFLAPDNGRDVERSLPQTWNGYAYVRNNPIVSTDPDGHVQMSQSTRKKYEQAKRYASKSKKGKETIDKLESIKGKKEPKLAENDQHINNYDKDENTINWDPGAGRENAGTGGEPDSEGNTISSPTMGLIHESAHAIRASNDPDRYSADLKAPDEQYGDVEHRRVITEVETPTAKQLNEPTRGSYAGHYVDVMGPTSKVVRVVDPMAYP